MVKKHLTLYLTVKFYTYQIINRTSIIEFSGSKEETNILENAIEAPIYPPKENINKSKGEFKCIVSGCHSRFIAISSLLRYAKFIKDA